MGKRRLAQRRRAAWPAVLAACGACSFRIGAGGNGTDDAGGDATGDATDDATGDGSVPIASCAPLQAPVAPVAVADVPSLRAALMTAAPNTTITLADGTYDLSASVNPILIATPGLTLRSASGAPDKVVITGARVASPLVVVRASNVTLASVTLTAAPGPALFVDPTVAANVTGTTVYDVTFLDNDGPAIRIRPFNGATTGPFADDGKIACSRFVITPTGGADTCTPPTLGIAADAVRGWTVRDNRFERLSCATTVRRTVAFRAGSRDTRLSGNVFLGSAMNIMLGTTGATSRTYADAPALGCALTPDHRGGVVCNNVIVGLGLPPIAANTDFEEGIALWNACDPWVLHNTIVSPAAGETYHDIEYRFAGTIAHLANNLLFQAPASRDGGQADAAYLASNALYASAADFVDASGGDLHLSATAAPPAGASIAGLGLCDVDADGKPRSLASPTVGAFER